MKVLVVNPSLFAPFYDYDFCRALVDIGVSTTMVGRPPREYEQRPRGQFELAELFYASDRKSGWQTSRLGHFRKGLEHAFGLYRLERLARQERADIVHFQWLVVPLLDNIALSRLRRHCGLVLTVHNSDITTHSAGSVVGTVGATLQSVGRETAVRRFDSYVVHSDQSRAQLLKLGIAPSRIVFKHHPPLSLPRPHVVRPAASRNILFFGQIKPYKGVDVLIEAGIALAATGRQFQITIAGRPFVSLDAMRAAISRASAEKFFRFDLDYLPDDRLAEHLAAADIVVFPYREIDGSGALSHALQFGKPIVASNVGGFAEPPFNEHIELVTPGDPKELATTLASLLDDARRRDELGGKAAALWQRLPSWTDFAKECRDAYETILKHRS